ncbi:MAG: PhzF family phenazine biosynthesis protein [Desulfoplanes sp.]
MRVPIYQVDAFTTHIFGGNPAAVCPLTTWLPHRILQSVAQENNLAETVYFVDTGDHFAIRWFTPEGEIDLCGHATLAAAHIIFQTLRPEWNTVVFRSPSHEILTVRREPGTGVYAMDFPAWTMQPCQAPAEIVAAMGCKPLTAFENRDLILIYPDERTVAALAPHVAFMPVGRYECIIATAPGTSADFVSRVFCPGASVAEDPVTGSAHCSLIPYWAKKHNRTVLHAHQISARGGEIDCVYRGNRVTMRGQAVTFMQGMFELPQECML